MTIQWVRDTESNSASISRLGTRGTLSKDVSYIVLGASTEDEIHVAANSYISTQALTWTYPNQPSVKLLAQSYDVEYLGDDAWRVTIRYERQGADNDQQQTPARAARSFDTGGGTEHRTMAVGGIGTPSGVRKFNLAGEVTAFTNPAISTNDLVIGFDGEQVHGVDVVAPALAWTETYDVPSSYVTAAYIKRVASLTGTINTATFRTFAAGEVLLVSVTGSQDWNSVSGDGPWTLTYKFEARPNAGSGQTLPALQIGAITGIEKRGHDYLWVRYSQTIAANKLVPSAEEVYVSRVYRDGDFSLLGIGVA